VDKKDVLKRISADKTSLDVFSEFNDDDKVVEAAVKNEGAQLQHASDRLRNKKDIVLLAMRQDPHALEHAGEEIRNHRDFMFKLIKKNKELVQYLGEDLRVSEDYHLLLVEKLGEDVLEHASKEIKDDKDFIIAALKIDKNIIHRASKRLRGDEDVVIASLRWGGTEDAMGESLKNDRAFIETLMDKNLLTRESPFDWLGPSLKQDKEFIWDHAEQYPKLIEAASDKLKATKSFFLKFPPPVLSQVFNHAHEELKEDINFLLEALHIDPGVKELIPKKLRKEVKKAKTK